MRSKKYISLKKRYNWILITLIVLLIITILFSNSMFAQEEQELIVVSEDSIVEANKKFSVVVKDENQNPIEEATVYIQNVYGDSGTTNKDGRAWLDAPGDRNEITVIAQKEGYIDGYTTVMVDVPLSFWELIQNPNALVVIAFILLVFAIVFVNLRRRRSKYRRADEISEDQVSNKYNPHGTVLSKPSTEIAKTSGAMGESLNLKVKREPKVEEIRISRPRRDKDVVSVEGEDVESKKSIDHKIYRKRDYDWFEGKDDIRYEIDKITGEIDEEGKDKWFEGIDDIRAKIDEKIKKKDKDKQN